MELKKIDVILPRPLVFRPCERKNVFFGVPKKCTFSGPGNAPDRRSGNFGSRNFRVREISRDADFPGFPAPWPDPEKSSIFRSSRPQKMPRNGGPRPSEMASPDTLSGPQKTASGTQKSCPRPRNPARPQESAQNPRKVPKTRKSARKRVFEPISSPDTNFRQKMESRASLRRLRPFCWLVKAVGSFANPLTNAAQTHRRYA